MGSLKFLAEPCLRGLRSRARSRATAEKGVRLWANRAIGALQQWWKGRLDDTLIHSASEGFGGREEPESSPLLMKIVGDVRQSWELRPPELPTGAAALRWQQGASPDSGL